MTHYPNPEKIKEKPRWLTAILGILIGRNRGNNGQKNATPRIPGDNPKDNGEWPLQHNGYDNMKSDKDSIY